MSKYSNETIEQTVEVFRALANPQRLRIFLQLADYCCGRVACDAESNGRTVGDLADDSELAASTVSHHLRELELAGLIEKSKAGKTVYCCLNRQKLEELQSVIAAVMRQGVCE